MQGVPRRLLEARLRAADAGEVCDNVVLKVGALIVHADEPKSPPPLCRVENNRCVRVYEIDTRYVGADPIQTNAVEAVSESVR